MSRNEFQAMQRRTERIFIRAMKRSTISHPYTQLRESFCATCNSTVGNAQARNHVALGHKVQS